ncbi:MAG: 2-hydroxyacyl-CoA dehydratase family protein [Pseudomonadota bacterium]|nr:2-hydroxyacyl-CoA dehydratase family protein [Pseudomonadota bacterium]
MQELERRLAEPVAALGGGDGVGYVGADVPVEVLLATGRPFGHLPWKADVATPWADQWLESSFPLWSRSILEQWHAGMYDALRDVVFTRADDAAQRLYYYVRELQRRGKLGGPAPRIFDLALVQRESSLAHSARAVVRLASELGAGADTLAAGIEHCNVLRGQLERLQGARSGHGPWFERLARAALWTDPGQWLASLPLPPPADRPRVLLAGSFPPDGRLHQAVEEGGASVVAETHGFRLDRLGEPLVDGAEEPARAIARHLIARSVGPRTFNDSAQWILRQARAQRASAVVLWLTREDESQAWKLPAQRAALTAAGLPFLALPAAHWLANDGVLDRIRAFCSEHAR